MLKNLKKGCFFAKNTDFRESTHKNPLPPKIIFIFKLMLMQRGVFRQLCMNPLPVVVAVFFVVSFVLSACSSESSYAGGNSAETGSPELAGVLTLADGSPARYARVNCVPQGFDMAKGGALDEAFVTAADSQGFYAFDSVPGGAFSLEAVHVESGNMLLVRDVSQDVHSLDRTLEQPGVAVIPAGLDVPDSSFVLVTSPGTTIMRKVMVIGGTVLVDSLPRSDLELHVLFDSEEVVLEQVSILPGDTVWIAEKTPAADSLPEKADESRDSLQPADTAATQEPVVFTYVAPLALQEAVRPGLDSLDDFPMAVRLNLAQDEMDSLDKLTGRWEAYRISADGARSSALPISLSANDKAYGQMVFWVSLDRMNFDDSLELVFDSSKEPAFANDVFSRSKRYSVVWHFDDGLFTTAAEQGLYSFDAPNVKGEGVVSNGAAFGDESLSVPANLSGDSSVVQNLDIDPYNKFFVSLWVRIDDINKEQVIFTRGDSAYTLSYVPAMGFVADLYHKATMEGSDTASFYWRFISGDTLVKPWNWTHVGVSTYGINGGLYVNGALVAFGDIWDWDGQRNEDAGFCFAQACNGERALVGAVDEFVLGGLGRDESWFYLSYLNQRSDDYWPVFTRRR